MGVCLKKEKPLPAPSLLALVGPPLSALMRMLHRSGSIPQRPVVREQPRRHNQPLFASPEAKPSPTSSELARGVSPLEGMVERQPARALVPVAPLQTTPPSGPTASNLFEYVRSLAGRRVEINGGGGGNYLKQIVDVVKANMEDAEQGGAAATGRKGGLPVDKFAMEALAYMGRGLTWARRRDCVTPLFAGPDQMSSNYNRNRWERGDSRSSGCRVGGLPQTPSNLRLCQFLVNSKAAAASLGSTGQNPSPTERTAARKIKASADTAAAAPRQHKQLCGKQQPQQEPQKKTAFSTAREAAKAAAARAEAGKGASPAAA
ncbi:hypothetical protein Emag_001198 [Eimeria magna]